MTIQRNRQYRLIVGDYKTGDGLLIENLQVTFDISKSSDNKNRTNSASIEVYNLSQESLKILDTDYPAASFEAGYVDTGGPKRLFAGQVTSVSTRKSGTDVITRITMGSGYTNLNHQILSELVPPGTDVNKVFEKIRVALGADRGVYNITTNLNNEIISGYPLSGTPREMLDEISEKFQLDWQLDDGVLYIHNNDRPATEQYQLAYVISPFTGLVERPYRVSGDKRRSAKDKAKKPGVQMKIMLNPEISAGSIIQIEEGELKGWYKVDSIRHYGSWRGDPWFTDIKGSLIEKVVKK